MSCLLFLSVVLIDKIVPGLVPGSLCNYKCIHSAAYNEKVVQYLRQPNIMDMFKERHPALASNAGLRSKITTIRNEGVDALDRMSNDVELIILLR